MAFNPDEYLSQKDSFTEDRATGFDPDAYLGGSGTVVATEEFNPDAYLIGAEQAQQSADSKLAQIADIPQNIWQGAKESFHGWAVGIDLQEAAAMDALSKFTKNKMDNLDAQGNTESFKYGAYKYLNNLSSNLAEAERGFAKEGDIARKAALEGGEDLAKGMISDVAKGLGGMWDLIPVAMSGGITMLSSAPSRMFDEGYQDALNSGKEEKEAVDTAIAYTLMASPLEIIADALILKGKGKVAKRTLAPILKSAAKKMGINFLSEGATETLQDGILNKLNGRSAFDQNSFRTFIVSGFVGSIAAGAQIGISEASTVRQIKKFQNIGLSKEDATTAYGMVQNGRLKEAEEFVKEKNINLRAVATEIVENDDELHPVSEKQARRIDSLAQKETLTEQEQAELGAIVSELNEDEQFVIWDAVDNKKYDGNYQRLMSRLQREDAPATDTVAEDDGFILAPEEVAGKEVPGEGLPIPANRAQEVDDFGQPLRFDGVSEEGVESYTLMDGSGTTIGVRADQTIQEGFDSIGTRPVVGYENLNTEEKKRFQELQQMDSPTPKEMQEIELLNQKMFPQEAAKPAEKAGGVAEPDIVGFSTRKINEARQERNEAPLTEQQAESHQKTMREAIESGQKDKSDDLAIQVLKTRESRNPRQLNRHEAAGMGARIVELRNERIDLYSKLRTAIASNNEQDIADATFEIEENAAKAKMIEEALKTSGLESGRANSVMASLVNRFTYDVVNLMDEARLAKGDVLTAEETASIDDTAKKIEEINAKIKDLEEQIRSGNIKIKEKRGKKIEPKELADARATLNALKREARNKIYDLRTKTKRDWLKEMATLPRTMMATADMSYGLRQGLLPSLAHPIIATKSWGNAFKAFFSQNTADQIDVNMKQHPMWDEMLRLGLHFSNMDSAINKREEFFASSLAEKIPVFGAVVRASERNMVSGLNMLRHGLMVDFLMKHPEASEKSKRAYARYVNIATGRGQGKMLDRSAEELSILFFAPRFAWSRVQAPIEATKNLLDPELRGEMVKQWAAYLGTGLTILALAKMWGADVGDDPQDSDFGKIVIGKKRIDIWGGVQQPMRILAKAISGGVEYQQTGATDVKPIEDIANFLKFKTSPIWMMGQELLTGRDVIGREVESDVMPTQVKTILKNMTPLVIQSAVESYNEGEDPSVVAAMTLGEGLGLSIQVYEKGSKKRSSTSGGFGTF